MPCKNKKHKFKNPLTGVRVYDNPQYADRYTVVIPNGDVFGMSSNPLSPQGINQYSGTIGMGDEGFSISNIERNAERVDKSKLPPDVKKAIIQRIKNTR